MMTIHRQITPIILLMFVIAGVIDIYAANTGRGGIEGGFYLQGIVRDSITGEIVPRASVHTLSGKRSAIADSRGIFGIAMSPGDDGIRVSSMGYKSKNMPVVRDNYNMIVVYLSPSKTELDELVVNRRKYSKKNNPAVDFVNRLRESASLGDPYNHDYYSFDKYERISFALNDFDPEADNIIMRNFPFLKEYVDTSDVSGKLILNMSVKEKSSTVNYRRKPKSLKTTVKGFKTTGIDEITDTESTQIVIEDLLREINLYDRDINLLHQRFVSPLSSVAPDFYKFYLTDTVTVKGDSCAVLSFYPFNRSGFGFTGHIYVVLGDSAMTIRRVDISVPREINLNFVERFYLTQTYENASDGSRLKASDDLTLELSPMPGMPSIYVRRSTTYGSHSFDAPDDDSVFRQMKREIVCDSVNYRSEGFWEKARLRPLSHQESRIGAMLDRFGTSKLFDICVDVVSALVQGYVALDHNDKFEYGPINTTVSFNPIEGTRWRAGGMTTAALSKHWFGRGYAAYGVSDHRWKYSGEVEYSFIEKRQYAREFPVHSIMLTHLYDIDYVGQHYLFTNPDNIFLSLKRMNDRNVIYHRETSLKYTLELYNNFSVTATLLNDRREATRWIPFIRNNAVAMSHYTENSINLLLRYAPGEKFVQTRQSRTRVNLDAPIFVLSQTFAPACLSEYPINRTELSVQKRFWLSAFGYLDMMAGAAKVWSRSSYIDLIIPNANLSYTIQRESFALLNPMEFINDSQLSWFLTYCPDGLIFNHIPGLKKAKLREAISFNGFYGHLSHRNLPSAHPDLIAFPDSAHISRMDKGPYMELSAGIDNILRCLRVDYVWRLSYRHTPYNIDRSGLRIALHFTF